MAFAQQFCNDFFGTRVQTLHRSGQIDWDGRPAPIIDHVVTPGAVGHPSTA